MDLCNGGIVKIGAKLHCLFRRFSNMISRNPQNKGPTNNKVIANCVIEE